MCLFNFWKMIKINKIDSKLNITHSFSHLLVHKTTPTKTLKDYVSVES